MLMRFYKLNIKALQKITPDTVEITFNIPTELQKTFAFIPGQYLTIVPQIDNEMPRRAYSICSDVTQKDISILIKKINKGKVSSYMNDVVLVNEQLMVAPPTGHFQLDTSKVKEESNYIFIGAGSGITPLISMITSLLKTTDKTVSHMFYGSRTEDTIIYRTKLDRLKLVYKDRLKIHHFISRDSEKNKSDGKYDFQYHKGRVDTNYIVSHINTIPEHLLNGVYLCGPAELIETAIEKFEAYGVNKELIHREYFTAPITEDTNFDMVFDDLPDRSVTVELEGRSVEILIKDDKDILRKLMVDGYDPPYSCLQGTCSTCKAKLVSGEVKMKVDIGLEADEIAQGYILTCQSIPLSKKTHCKYEN